MLKRSSMDAIACAFDDGQTITSAMPRGAVLHFSGKRHNHVGSDTECATTKLRVTENVGAHFWVGDIALVLNEIVCP
jgi:hypothetical protein